MLADVYGYGAPIWSRFCAPAHAGRLDAAAPGVASAEAGTPASGARLQLQAQRRDGRIVAARFLAYGCPVTIAVGEWLAARIEGEPVDRWRRLGAADIRAALEIAEDKSHCAVMGEDVLRALAERIEVTT